MKKLKERLVIGLIILGVCSFIFGIGYIKYKVWKLEHPLTSNWVFFIPSK